MDRVKIPGLLRIAIITALAVISVMVGLVDGAEERAKPAKKILLLYSYQAVLPANLEWDGGIRTALKGTAAEPIEFFTEYLDLAQFPQESYLQKLINLLRAKYGDHKIDLAYPVCCQSYYRVSPLAAVLISDETRLLMEAGNFFCRTQ
jgi:hypothetical protein